MVKRGNEPRGRGPAGKRPAGRGADPRRGRPNRSGEISQSRLVAVAVLAGAVLIAGVIAAIGLKDDDKGSDTALTTSTTAALSTTTTFGTDDSTVPTFTTQPPPTTVAPTATTVATTRTTVASSGGTCGKGTVSASPRSGTPVSENGTYTMPLSAQVTSNYDRDVEVVELVVRVTFADGSHTDVTFQTAGVTIAAGATHTFNADDVQSQSQPTQTSVQSFSYQAAGRPDCRASL